MTVSAERILVIKFGALGDVVRTGYILKGLQEKFRGADIYWFTAESSLELLRYNPRIFKVITPSMNYDLLTGTAFDIVISLDDEPEILKEIERVDYRGIVGAHLEDGNPVYTPDSAEWFDMGLISRFGKERADWLKKNNLREHNQILAAMLDIEINEGEFFNSSLLESGAAQMFDHDFFNIGLNSGAGGRWASKQLPMKETLSLIERLLQMEIQGKETRIYLLGGEEERSRHMEIMKRFSSDRLRDAGNDNSLQEFAAIIKWCDYLISSDSLAIHLAISQGVKNLSFYAPTSAAEIGTFGTGVKVVSLTEDYCSYRRDADNSTITAERIVVALRQHLDEVRING